MVQLDSSRNLTPYWFCVWSSFLSAFLNRDKSLCCLWSKMEWGKTKPWSWIIIYMQWLETWNFSWSRTSSLIVLFLILWSIWVKTILLVSFIHCITPVFFLQLLKLNTSWYEVPVPILLICYSYSSENICVCNFF